MKACCGFFDKKKSNMKKFIQFFALLMLVSLGGSFSSFTKPVSTVSSAMLVTNKDVISYLGARGYTNVTVIYQYANGDRLCTSSYPYQTRVFTNNNTFIGGWEDIN
jgi:hypothetical protein